VVARPPRVANAISRKQAESARGAAAFADAIGLPLNTHVTINFAYTSLEGEEAWHAFTRLRTVHFRHWLTYRAKKAKKRYGPPTFLWAWENAPSEVQDRLLLHVHWAVHVPPELADEFAQQVLEWVRKIGGQLDESQCVVKVDPATRPRGLETYLLKDVDARYRKHFNIKHFGSYGPTFRKRCSPSQNIGKAARKAWLARQNALIEAARA